MGCRLLATDTPPRFICCSDSKITDYTIERFIGGGGYGQVYEVKRKSMDKQSYALKIVKLLDRFR